MSTDDDYIEALKYALSVQRANAAIPPHYMGVPDANRTQARSRPHRPGDRAGALSQEEVQALSEAFAAWVVDHGLDWLDEDEGDGDPLRQPLVGYKALLYDHDEHALISPRFTDYPWPRYKRLEAHCLKSAAGLSRFRMLQHSAPDARCGCGIHAALKVEKAMEYMNYRGFRDIMPVLAEVYLWGHVMVNAAGYRAQYAYPKKLWLVTNNLFLTRSWYVAEDMAENYGVETSMTTKMAIMRAAFDADKTGQPIQILEMPRYIGAE